MGRWGTIRHKDGGQVHVAVVELFLDDSIENFEENNIHWSFPLSIQFLIKAPPIYTPTCACDTKFVVEKI